MYIYINFISMIKFCFVNIVVRFDVVLIYLMVISIWVVGSIFVFIEVIFIICLIS